MKQYQLLLRYGTSVQSVKDVAAQGKYILTLNNLILFKGFNIDSEWNFELQESTASWMFRPMPSSDCMWLNYILLPSFSRFATCFWPLMLNLFFFQPKCTDSLLEMNKRMTEEQVQQLVIHVSILSIFEFSGSQTVRARQQAWTRVWRIFHSSCPGRHSRRAPRKSERHYPRTVGWYNMDSIQRKDVDSHWRTKVVRFSFLIGLF